MRPQEEGSHAQLAGYTFGLVSGLCYGAWSVIAKTALNDFDFPPLLFAATAFCFGSIMFAPVLAHGLPGALRLSKRASIMFALSGVGSGVAIIAMAFGLEKGDVVVVSPIVSVSPLVTLILVRLFLEKLERVTMTLALGSMLVVGGAALVVLGDSL